VEDVECPENFIAVEDSNTTCTKPAPISINQGESCPDGTEEWEANLCYEQCPPFFADNGLSCLKRSFTRDAFSLRTECSNIFYYSPFEGAPCTVSPIGLWIITLCIIGGVWLIYVIYTFVQKPTLKVSEMTQEDSILKQIDNYFTKK
jgi:hypothetical protein